MKKFELLIILLLGAFIIVNLKEKNNNEKEKNKNEIAERNRCIRILVEEDEIENGCDVYFLEDKWYIDYNNMMFDEYEKIKKGLR